MSIPKLRVDDAYPIRPEDETYIVLRDRDGLAEPVMVSPMAFFVACLFDGERDAEGVRKAFAEKYDGAQIRVEEVEEVWRQLDERLLLDSDRYHEAHRKMLEEFAGGPVRESFNAGKSYADTGDDLAAQLGEYFTAEGGAGEPGEPSPGAVTGILAPHIDFSRGGLCYSYAYRRLAEASDADLFLILGVAHSSPESPFVLTRKHFATPLGTAETDVDFVDRLTKRAGKGLFEHEIVHRTEHSAEFQAVFLRHVRRERPFQIVPVLCSAFERYCGDGSPSEAAEVEDRIQAFAETIRETGKKVCIVGGVDFAHVGPRFGDPYAVDAKLINWMKEEDAASLEQVEKGDAEGFWKSVMADGNRRHVCGLSATYAALRLLAPVHGRILKYSYAPDPAGGIVSFASVEFGGPAG